MWTERAASGKILCFRAIISAYSPTAITRGTLLKRQKSRPTPPSLRSGIGFTSISHMPLPSATASEPDPAHIRARTADRGDRMHCRSRIMHHRRPIRPARRGIPPRRPRPVHRRPRLARAGHHIQRRDDRRSDARQSDKPLDVHESCSMPCESTVM